MLQAWETFYLMIGGSSAALVGVMFIVMTLTAEVAVEQINRGTTIYQSPTVFHLGAITAVSSLALVPEHLMMVVAVLIGVMGLAGLVYAGTTIRRMSQPYDFYTATGSDHLFFGWLPGATYLLMLGGAVAVMAAPEIAAEAIGAATLLLLLVSIRNAWDLATFSVRVTRTIALKEARKTETAP